ncbi:glycosyltransferase domain-containing protein [Marinoscillum sp.]|uniref:glycosyltransferase domain-containing protein n=1 Tax=Marinoscillum sp. TaxID=2024838 RepID=UPI003BAA58A8
MGLKLVTLVDKVDERMSPLQRSCEEYGLQLEVVVGTTWKRNAFKFRVLEQYLLSEEVDDDDVLLLVDAFDVVVNAGEQDIMKRYLTQDADVVFSAEANYYFREADLSLKYWRIYPRQEGSVYHFLNSGTFMARAWALKSLLTEISATYAVDYQDDDQLYQVRSDQYLYSRYYVDTTLGLVNPKFTIKLDAKQDLFGCSGGRMCVASWGRVSEIQDYLFFKYERRMLKTFWIKETQENCRDLKFSDGQFHNTLTGSSPVIIHLPGTYTRFETVLSKIKGRATFTRWTWARPLALALSLVAFLRSVVNYGYIRSVNGGITGIKDIFPLQRNTDLSRFADSSTFQSGKCYPKDNPFTI